MNIFEDLEGEEYILKGGYRTLLSIKAYEIDNYVKFVDKGY